MQLLDEREFRGLIAEGRPCGHYDFSLYYGLAFDCACGASHELKPWMEIVTELPLMRFVVACPSGYHLVIVKARWSRSQAERMLESEAGTRLSERWRGMRGVEFQAELLAERTGRQWSLEDTAALMEQDENERPERKESR